MARSSEDLEIKADNLVVLKGGGASLIPVEDIPVEDSDRIRHRIIFLRDSIDTAYFELSQRLHQVWNGVEGKPLYLKWGYHSFNEYVTKELDFKIRKAQYLISIWHWFGEKVGDKSLIEKVKPLGWTKVKELVGVVSKQNADEWIEKAKNMSAPALADEARAVLRADKALTDKMEMAPAEVSEAINRKTQPLHRWPFALFTDQFNVVEAAITQAKKIGKTEKEGQALSLICQDFLATNQVVADGSEHREYVAAFLSKFESLLGIKIIAIKPEEKEIIYGADLVTALGGPKLVRVDGGDQGGNGEVTI